MKSLNVFTLFFLVIGITACNKACQSEQKEEKVVGIPFDPNNPPAANVLREYNKIRSPEKIREVEAAHKKKERENRENREKNQKNSSQ